MTREEQGFQNRLLGRWGEERVTEYLRGRGWDVIGTRFQSRFGEVDLISIDGRFLVFTEVKLRKSAKFGSAAEAVSRGKQERIRLTASFYLEKHSRSLGGYQPRFDVAEVYAPQGMNTKKPEIHYIENAF